MNDLITLDNNFSTTRHLIKSVPVENPEVFAVIANAVKQSHKPEDKFETVLFLPEGENRQGEGGLRTKGYFKVDGLISEASIIASTNPRHCEEHSETAISKKAHSPETKPLITVVTVVFNGEKFLEETILSVINQTYDNVEYIIIDGGSTDGTLDIIKKYEHVIDYWVSEKDKGIYDAMNKGIDAASGDWINFMNGGDIFSNQDVLLAAVSHMTASQAVILYGDYIMQYATKNKLMKPKPLNKMWQGSVLCHQSVFIRTTYHKENKYSLNYRIAGDFNFFYSSYMHNVKFIKIPVVIAKVSYGGVSTIQRVNSRKEFYTIIDKSYPKFIYYKYMILLEYIKIIVKKIIRHES